MRAMQTFLCGTLILAALVGFADNAQAQFTMNSVGRDGNLKVAIPVDINKIETHVINKAEARVLRKELWKQRNLVDFWVEFTGDLTEYNKSWANNNQNSKSGQINTHYIHTYTKNRHTSLFKFEGKYGFNYVDNAWFKNNDELKLYYRAGWSIKKEGFLRNWEYSFTADFLSQFTEGYKSRTDKTRWSNFMAPGRIIPGVGFTYRSPDPKLPIEITLNPVAGTVFFLLDDGITDNDRRGKLNVPVVWVPDPTPDNPDNKRAELRKYRTEGGSNIIITFRQRAFRIGKKGKGVDLLYKSDMSSFYGWMTQVGRHDPTNSLPAIMPTFKWKNVFTIKPMKFFSIAFEAETNYDKGQVDKIQIKYNLKIGLTYQYKNK